MLLIMPHSPFLFSFPFPPLMLLYSSLLVLTLIHRPTSAQPTGPSTSTTNGPLLLPSGNVGTGLDAGNVGSVIGGATAAAVTVIMIALAFSMLRRSRRLNRLCYNKELEEVVPPLPYRKRNGDVDTASVDSSEFDLQLPAPALLRAASLDTVTTMREIHFEEPPIHFLSTSPTTQSSSADHSLP